MVLRSALGYKAASSSQAGHAAFKDATKYLVQNMLKSISKALEITLLYGQVGYATVGSVAVNTITVPAGEFAAGIWAGAEKMPINIRTAAGVSRGNANIVSVNMTTREIEVDLMPAGVVATDVIYRLGAYGNEFAGLHKIMTNTGVLFNIDAAQFSLWKANSYDCSPSTPSALSFDKIQEAITLSVEKGLDSDVVCLVSTKTWADLLTEQAAARMYDESYTSEKSENGSRSIKFHSQNGVVEIVPSIHVKPAYAYIFDKNDLIRVGSSDVTFKRPGRGDEFFRDLENNAGYELRTYSDQALFCSAPGKCTLIIKIANGV